MNSIMAREFESSWMIPESCVSAKRIREALSIIDAINAGELLGALPAAKADRHRHLTAVSLLDILEKSLRNALSDAPAIGRARRAANAEAVAP